MSCSASAETTMKKKTREAPVTKQRDTADLSHSFLGARSQINSIKKKLAPFHASS